jgi:hypothetical protein
MNLDRHMVVVSFRSRFARSLIFYGVAWVFGATALTTLQITLPDRGWVPHFQMSKPHANRQAPVVSPTGENPRSEASAPTVSVSPSKDELFSDDKAWEATQVMGSQIAYFDYIKTFPNGRHVAEAKDMIQSISSFISCSKKRTLYARSAICTEDLLIDLVSNVDNNKNSFNWSALKVSFGKALFAAGIESMSSALIPGTVSAAEFGFSLDDHLASSAKTTTGVLFQFGSKELENTFGADSDSDKHGVFDFAVETKPNSERAIQLYREAAREGDPNAAIMLGIAYTMGSDVQANKDSAISYFAQAEARIPIAAVLKTEVQSGSRPKE